MLFLADYCHPFMLESVSGPVVPKHAWFYDVQVNDFILKPIMMLEETTGQTVRMRVNSFDFDVPASWFILVVDDDTKQVDTVSVTQCGSSTFKAFMMHPQLNRYELSPIQLLDLEPDGSVVHLLIPRQTLLCHPVGPSTSSGDLSLSCLIGPQDVGRHMGDLSAQELLI